MADVTFASRGTSAADTATRIQSVDATIWTQTSIPAILARIPTLYVAASDSYNKAYAPFQCDGTADDVQIQAAIDALPAQGGIVHLLAGTYRLAQTVLIDQPSVILEGEGRATILEPVNAFANDTHMLKVFDDAGGNQGCVVRHLRLSGANTTFSNTVHGLWFTSELGFVDDVRIWQMSGDGMWLRNSAADSNVSKAKFTRLDVAACGRYGMWAICGDNHFSDSVFRANVDSNFYGSLAGCMIDNCHFFASTENKAGTQTFYDLHLVASERNYFSNCKFEHAYKSPVWLDGNPSGGKAYFVNCCVRDGSGEGSGLHPQVLISRSGGAFWNVIWCNSRFDADHGEPTYNIQINGGAVRNGRFYGNTYVDALTGIMSAFTTGGTGSVGYRSTLDGLGVNAGDPNSAGDWTGAAGRVGTMVRNTADSKIWLCTVANGITSTWVALN